MSFFSKSVTRKATQVIRSVSSVLLLALAACSSSSDPTPTPGTGTPTPDPAPVVDCPAPTAGPTVHKGGDVADGEVWSANGSPHIVEGDITIRGGAKLTIEPCATVQVAKAKHLELAFPGTPNVGGTLIAEGTANKPISFSGKDGEKWASLYVVAPGTARLAYVTMKDGGGGDFENNATIDVIGDGVLPADPLLSVDHVTIDGSIGTGIWMQRGSSFTKGSKDLVVKGSGNEENPYPLEIDEHVIDALPTGTYTGNKVDEIRLTTFGFGVAGGGLAVDATLHDRGVPYHMGASHLDNFVISSPEGQPASTLTIEAGVVMKFEPETAFKVQAFTGDAPAKGAVIAKGTAEKPIVFTSAAASPKAGDWRGIWFGGAPLATNALDHVRIEYAGYDCGCILNTCSKITGHEGAVIFSTQVPSPFITNTMFKAIAGHGVTEGYDGTFVNFRPTNTFEGVSGCTQTLPRGTDGMCAAQPACDGL